MTGLEPKVTLDVLKPVGSFVEAALGPKIENLKKWAKESDLKGKLNATDLANFFNGYLVRLYRYTSEVTTIVLPNLKLNVNDIYEPLLIADSHKNLPPFCFTINQIRPGENYSIIDRAGMGKTTFVKHLINELLDKSGRIPILIELRNVENGTTLIDCIKSELEGIDDKLSIEMLLKLLASGKFVLFLDGFDEVSNDNQKPIIKEIIKLAVKGDRLSIILTSRPQNNIPNLVNSKTYEFKPLTKEQAISLILKYDNMLGFDIGKRLSCELDKVPPKFIDTPLLVSLLYRSYGFNNSIATKITAFYDEIFDALYKGHDLTKNFVRHKKSKLEVDDFRKLLRAFSYVLLLNKKYGVKTESEAVQLIEIASNLSAVKPNSYLDFFEDLLVAVPLMIRDGIYYKFIHNTIIEFFAAEYIVCADDSTELAEEIVNSTLFGAFKVVFEFIFELNPLLYKKVITLPLAKKIIKLKEFSSEREAILQTFLFINGEGFISVWKHDDVVVGKGREASMNVPVPPCGEVGQMFFYGTLNGKKHVLVCTLDERASTHKLAWGSVSSKLLDPSKYNEAHRHKIDFDNICTCMNIGKWYSLRSEQASKFVEINAIISSIFQALSFSQVGIDKLEKQNVLDIAKCRDLITNAEKEDEYKKHIKSLLLKPSRTKGHYQGN